MFNVRKIALAVATGLGSGYSPRLPGTTGSLVCVALWYALSYAGIRAPLILPAAVVIIGLLSIRICLDAAAMAGNTVEDPSFIVIDEWAGMLIALAGVSPDQPARVLTAFLLFRFFDMAKPGPVSWAERLPREWGVMADDVIAGLAAAAVLLFAAALSP